MKIPLFFNTIKAGFPSPAEDFIEDKLNLNHFLIEHPASTFFVKVSGDSMINAGILPGSILIVDRSLDPHNNSTVVAVIDSEFTVKRLGYLKNERYLFPENPKYKPIKLKDSDEIWGVVTAIITQL